MLDNVSNCSYDGSMRINETALVMATVAAVAVVRSSGSDGVPAWKLVGKVDTRYLFEAMRQTGLVEMRHEAARGNVFYAK